MQGSLLKLSTRLLSFGLDCVLERRWNTARSLVRPGATLGAAHLDGWHLWLTSVRRIWQHPIAFYTATLKQLPKPPVLYSINTRMFENIFVSIH